jgi:hypothetical protein
MQFGAMQGADVCHMVDGLSCSEPIRENMGACCVVQ